MSFNKDKNGHRFALSGELLEREKEREKEYWDIIHRVPIIHGEREIKFKSKHTSS